MGGVVNVAVRFGDGTVVCQERWTNNISYWLKRPAIHADEQGARDYLAMVRNNDHVIDPGSPGSLQPVENSEYGLVVIDYVNRVILDNNAYSNLASFASVHAGGGMRSEAFEECAQAGILRHRTRVYDRATRTKVSETVSDRLSEEDALRLGDEIYGREFRDDRPEGSRRVMEDFVIDPVGFTIEILPQDDEGAMAARLKEIGFPTTLEEGVNAHLPPTQEGRKVTKQEETARRLFQEWKKAEGSKGAAYDGMRYDDAPERVTTALMAGAATYLCDPESLPQVLATLDADAG